MDREAHHRLGASGLASLLTRMTIDIVSIAEELEVRIDNLAAIRLYERVGFAHEGRKRNRLRYDGVTFDGLVMGLLFDAASA